MVGSLADLVASLGRPSACRFLVAWYAPQAQMLDWFLSSCLGRLPSGVTTYPMIPIRRDGPDPAPPTLEVTDMTVCAVRYAAHNLAPATCAFRVAWRSYVTSFLLVFLYTR